MNFITSFDNTVLYFIYNNWRNDITNHIFAFISTISNYGFIWIAMATIMLFNKKWRSAGIILLLSLALSELIGTLILKNVICRMRPFNIDTSLTLITSKPGGYYSFPSGHSIAAGTGAAVTFMRKKAFGIAVSVYSLLLGFSRIFLAVHYPTDVIAGLILGIGCSVLIWKLMYDKSEAFIEKHTKEQE